MIKLPRKTAKKSRSEVYLANLGAMGPEREFAPGHKLSFAEKAKAFSWYAYMADTKDAREYLGAYLTRTDREDMATTLATVADQSFPLTAAWLARMDELGADIGESKDFITKKVEETIAKYAEKQIVEAAARDRVSGVDMAVNSFIGDLDTIIDKRDWEFNVYEALKANSFPTSAVSRLTSYYAPLLSEISQAAGSGLDGYKDRTKADLKQEQAWLEKMLSDCTTYGSNERKLRAPRKKKAASAEKKLKYFVYKKEDLELKLASVDPAGLIGATEAYLFNTKYKSISVLTGNLDVKGKSVVGYDEEKSFTKNCGRKSKEIADTVAAGGKVSIARALELCTGKPWPKAKASVDENTIILRVAK